MYQPGQPSPVGGLGESHYGPPILVQPHRKPRRNCCSILVKFLAGFIVMMGIIVLVLWLVYRPRKIQVSLDNASLSRFQLTTSSNNNNTANSLAFRLATNISLHNPNTETGVYYDHLEAGAYYNDHVFSQVPLPIFYQRHRNTTTVSPLFEGISSLLATNNNGGDAVVSGFKRDNETGVFKIDVWLYARLRYKFASLFTRKYVARVKCGLALKLETNSTASNWIAGTQCDIVDF